MLSLVEATYADQDSELLEDGDFCGHQPRKISVLECVHDGVVVPGPYYESSTGTKLYNVQNSTTDSASTRGSTTPELEQKPNRPPQQQHQLLQHHSQTHASAKSGQGSNGEDSTSNSGRSNAGMAVSSSMSDTGNHTHGVNLCSSGEKVSRTNLYIKGLPDSFSDEKLWNLPPDQTQIKSVKAATDDDGKCRGYGFIDFVNETVAIDALKHIKETYPAFTIKFAKENEKDKTNLYVTHLPKSWTTKDSEQLKSVFERFGPIQSAFVMMERSTNRTTGVGFVRFANERDALAALDSIRTNPIMLPECTEPVEAKFADKHNPDTRRRRYPATTSVLQASNMSNLFGYPLALGHAGAPVASTDPLTALINGSLSVHHQQQQQQQQNAAAAQRLAQGLLATPVSGKLSSVNNSHANPMDFTSLNMHHGNSSSGPESQLNAFAAAAVAAAALLGGGGGNGGGTTGTVNGNSMRSNPNSVTVTAGGAFNPISLNAASLFSTAPLSLMTNSTMSMATGAATADPTLLDPNIYGCTVYGADYYRQQQQQQQQQQLAAAVAAMNSVTPSGSLYSPVPDLAQYMAYPSGLLGSHPGAATLNGSANGATCLAATGAAGLAPIYSAQATGLLQAPSSALADPLGLVTNSRPTAATVHSWLLHNPLLKTGSGDPTVPIAQAAMLSNNPTGMSGFDRNCKHVQLFI